MIVKRTLADILCSDSMRHDLSWAFRKTSLDLTQVSTINNAPLRIATIDSPVNNFKVSVPNSFNNVQM